MKIKLLYFVFLLSLFASCSNKDVKKIAPLTGLSAADSARYLDNGRKITAAAFALLSSKVKEKIENGGPLEAVNYCNLAALKLTDSIAASEKVLIKRTSLKIRNPKNSPDNREKAILNNYQQNFEAGRELGPQIMILEDGSVAYHSPILMLPLCSKCHGKEIGKALSEKLMELYPDDQAIGFTEGELRGMWTLIFKQ